MGGRRTMVRHGDWSLWRRAVVALAIVAALLPALAPDDAAAAAGPVTVVAILCPDGYDIAMATPDDLAMDCITPLAGISLTLTPSGEPGQAMLTGGGGVASWPVITEGPGTIAASVGNPSRAFCAVAPQGMGPGVAFEYGAAGNVLAYALGDGEEMLCSWYFQSLAPVPPAGEVRITAYACPAGYDATAAPNLDQLMLDCADIAPDQPFAVAPAMGEAVFGSTDAMGFGLWAPVAEGPGTVMSESGFWMSARVFCATYDLPWPPAAAPVYMEYAAPGNVISYDLAAGEGLACIWFNADPIEPSFVTAYKLACDDGYDWTAADLMTLQTDCATPLEGVTFQLGGPATDLQDATDMAGIVSWQVDPGDYILSEVVPAGYGQPRVFCGTFVTSMGPGMISEVMAEDASVSFTLDPSTSIDCYWFNRPAEPPAPAGPASLTLDVFTCISDHDPITAEGATATACSEPTMDVPFSLEGTGTTLGASTGEGGAPATIRFAELEPGVYLLSADLPDEIAWAYVAGCQSDVRGFSTPFTPFTVIEPGGRVLVELLPGEDLRCAWHDILAPEPAQLLIAKSWCDGDAQNLTNCEPWGGGVQFVITNVDDGRAWLVETDATGEAVAEVPAGAYRVIEVGRAWCAAESDAVDTAGNVVLTEGEVTRVDIANCGPRPLT